MNTLQTTLIRVARFPDLRSLAWAGDRLYAPRGVQHSYAHIQDRCNIEWRTVAQFPHSFRRRPSASNRLTARLFRDGFHALVALPSGTIIGAVPGAIVTLPAGPPEFRQTHAITRGTRPLHITAVPDRTLCWGEYFDDALRDEVHI